VSSESQWSAPTSDTSNLLNNASLDALFNVNGAARGFAIDHDRVPQAIADLEHAAEFFKEQAKTARSLARIPAPGIDGVSLNAVEQIGKWASDTGVNNLEATLTAGALQLKDIAHKLREDLKIYLQVEELNIPQPSPGLPL
jgi:hypothetical protein